MALNSVNIYLANSKYTYTIDNQDYCGGFADIFDINTKKENIMYELLNQVNNNLYTSGLIAVFQVYDKGDTNEDYYYFEIFEGVEGFNEDDYRSRGNKYGFGFIENRVV